MGRDGKLRPRLKLDLGLLMSHRVPLRPLIHPTNPRSAQCVVQHLAEVHRLPRQCLSLWGPPSFLVW